MRPEARSIAAVEVWAMPTDPVVIPVQLQGAELQNHPIRRQGTARARETRECIVVEQYVILKYQQAFPPFCQRLLDDVRHGHQQAPCTRGRDSLGLEGLLDKRSPCCRRSVA